MQYVRHSIICQECVELNRFETEAVWCRLNCRGTDLYVGVVYRSQSASDTEIEIMQEMIKAASKKAASKKAMVVQWRIQEGGHGGHDPSPPPNVDSGKKLVDH